MLEDKFRDLLVKYNMTQKENEKNERLVFTLGTGANMQRYNNFLDEDGDFTSGKKKRSTNAAYKDEFEDELNKLNRDTF